MYKKVNILLNYKNQYVLRQILLLLKNKFMEKKARFAKL